MKTSGDSPSDRETKSRHHHPTSPPKLQTRHNNRPVLTDPAPIPALALNHKINGKTQPAASHAHIRAAERALHDLRIIRHDGDIIASTHEFLEFAGAGIGFGLEDFEHVFLCVGGLGRGGAVAVGGDVEGFVGVEQFEDVGGRRDVDDGGGDDLVHCFVVGGVGGVVQDAGAGAVDVYF